MHFFKSTLHLTLPIVALAQGYGYGGGGGGGGGSTTTTAGPSAPSAPPSSQGQINVDVYADGQFVFKPANFSAPNGTSVTFYFPSDVPTNHSVTQSSFNAPCTHLEANATTNTPAGFDSGLTNTRTFTINITDDTRTIWFHCKNPLHCGMGMVGSINAPLNGTNTFEAFQAKAKAIGSNEVTEPDNGAVTGGVGGVATAGPAAESGSSSSSSNDSAKIRANIVVLLSSVILVASLL